MTRWQGWLVTLSAVLVALVLTGPPLWSAVSSTIQHREDAAHVSSDIGTMSLTVRQDAAAALSGTDADYQPLITDSGGRLWTRGSADPCSYAAKTYVVINVSTAATTELVNGFGASNSGYICSFHIQTDAANDILLAEDDTDDCVSISAGLAGGTSAATGWNLAASSGIALGNGNAAVLKTAGTNRFLCLVTSANTQATGSLSYVAAP